MVFEQIGYFFLALTGLSFLIFIHELGHYIVARRVGMRVETFSIGFGRPIWSVMRDGVKWQIGMFPFGGFVKIAGMEKEKGKDPQDIPDGYYGKGPWARIKVAFAGPLVNIIFALLAFTFLWAVGGRIKSFSEYTSYLGLVDRKSELYQNGVRPGDEITQLNGRPYTGFKDVLYSSLINGRDVEVQGYKIDRLAGSKVPFDYSLTPYPHPFAALTDMTTIGLFAPAKYLIYEKHIDGRQNPLYPGSPMFESGIQYGDRIVWVDGELVFSDVQLSRLVNEKKALLTVQRGDTLFLAKVPRIQISDIRLTKEQRDEFEDWAHETELSGKIGEQNFIPYDVTKNLTVERSYTFIDETSNPFIFDESTKTIAPLEVTLQKGDKIVAVDGSPLTDAYDFFKRVQQKHVEIIVDRGSNIAPILSKESDKAFEDDTKWVELKPLVATFGMHNATRTNGRFVRLNTVTPVSYRSFPLPDEKRGAMASAFEAERRRISEIKDPKQQVREMDILEKQQSRLMLGITLQDRQVRYNPNPLVLASDVLSEMKRTITGLFSGDIGAKHLMGPIGIVTVMNQSWAEGFTEAIFWLGLISLNLAVLNLLPLPVLDGGHICFAFLEAVRKKPLKQKTMERIVIPFVALLIALFVYLTFHDIARLFGRFF